MISMIHVVRQSSTKLFHVLQSSNQTRLHLSIYIYLHRVRIIIDIPRSSALTVPWGAVPISPVPLRACPPGPAHAFPNQKQNKQSEILVSQQNSPPPPRQARPPPTPYVSIHKNTNTLSSLLYSTDPSRTRPTHRSDRSIQTHNCYAFAASSRLSGFVNLTFSSAIRVLSAGRVLLLVDPSLNLPHRLGISRAFTCNNNQSVAAR